MLFGDNIEWANEGMGIWRPDLHGFDPQIVAMIKESGVTHLRYPGGTLSDYFHWQQSIGDSRTPQVDPFNKGATQMPDFGPDEFMALCRTLGIKGSITLNAGTGTPDEAAAWVKYNADKHFDVTPYEVGNEIYMVDPANPEVPGLPIYRTASDYVAFYKQCQAVVDRDTPGTKLGGIGIDDTGPFKLSHDPNWLPEITSALGDKMAFVADHNSYATATRTATPDPQSTRYSDDEFAKCLMGASVFVRSNMDATESLLRASSPDGRAIPLHITESGPFLIPIEKAHIVQDVAWNRCLAGALYEACLLNLFCQYPNIQSANHIPMCQDNFGALIGIRGSGPTRVIWRNAVYYVFSAFSKMSGRSVLTANVTCPDYATQQIGTIPAQTHVPCLDAGAYLTIDGKQLSIFLINRDVARTASVKIDPGSRHYRAAVITTLTASSYLAEDRPSEPNNVFPSTRGIPHLPDGPIALQLPAHSLVEMDLKAE
jgi:alpha-N-arabinofuranosidase